MTRRVYYCKIVAAILTVGVLPKLLRDGFNRSASAGNTTVGSDL